MKRRSFLKAIAAASIGLLASRSAGGRQWMPPPRWEWKVGEWLGEGGGMICGWEAIADILPSEVPTLLDAMLALNSSTFCGIGPGQLKFTAMDITKGSHHLHRCTVFFTEFRTPKYDMCVYANAGFHEYLPYRRVNFHGVFRGDHAVVSVGEKETTTPPTEARHTVTLIGGPRDGARVEDVLDSSKTVRIPVLGRGGLRQITYTRSTTDPTRMVW